MYRLGKKEVKAVKKVIMSKNLFRSNDGEREVDNFEKELSHKLKTDYALCVSGGTGALIAALIGMEIGPGDEVIIPSYTFMATAIAVLATGAIPVIVDIDDTLTIDPSDIKKKISRYTKAILPVHILGFPSNMDEICKIAKKNNLKIIEDACQADGGSYKGKRLGSIGDVGALSFNYYKIITSGEGGAVVTSNKKAYERALVYHDGGAAFRPYASELTIPIFSGTQMRVSEITGAILRVQLKRLDGILRDLRLIKKEIMDELSDIPNIVFARSNDLKGDCGCSIAFSFNNEKDARRFATSEGVGGLLPIDSGKHVYTNWDPILNKKGAHHPLVNPYNLPENSKLNMNYSKDMCIKSLNILKRNVIVSLQPDWTQEIIERKVESIKKAAKRFRAQNK